MIALVQRVREARVEIDQQVVGRIGVGLLVLVCAEPEDTSELARKLVDKLLKLRIFSDAAGKMNLDVTQVGGGLLLVSQFTLAADTRGGNRPSFAGAAPPTLGQSLFDEVVGYAQQRHPEVACGRFGADMQVHLVNDGPVTIPLRIGH